MSPRLFLLEDDDIVVGLVKAGIDLEGWEFRHHPRVQGALEAIAGFKPDLALLDINLPDGDGFEVCAGIRRNAALAAIPVIILTAKGDSASRLKGFAAGAQDYVAKPFELAELLARARAHLALKGRQDKLESELMKVHLHERVRQDVADMIVHDLRTPLSTVKVTFDLIESNGLITREPFAHFFEYAKHSLDLAMLMVNDLLDLGAGRLKLEPARVDLPRLFAELQKIFALQFQQKKTTLNCELPSGDVALLSDPVLLFRVLVNLVSNSLKFTPSGIPVTVKAFGTPAGLRFEVLDQGDGIPDAEKDLIFEKYFRSPTPGNNPAPGTGIGLAFCRMAANTLRGRIWVEDGQPKGSRFILEVPSLAPAPADNRSPE